MARYCSICRRTDAGAINALLQEGRSARSVASEFDLSEDAVQRHARNHAQRVMAAPVGVPAVFTAGSSSSQLSDSTADPLDELVAALRLRALAGDPGVAHEYRLALGAQNDVRHAAPPSRDLAAEPDWLALRTTILRALEAFPAARVAVADALAANGMD